MTVEISVEAYLFTCARCGARWAEDYQVSQMVDDAGAIRSFYRHHGDPCEAPLSGNVECPDCHATEAFRNPLYGPSQRLDLAELASHAPAVPAQRGAVESYSGPARRTACRTWRRFKFSAVVSLDAGRSRRQYLSGVPGLVLRAASCVPPARLQYFPAVLYTDDNRSLRPGDKGLRVVMSVPDDDAAGFFQPGQRFTLWDGNDIGHGTVAQRLFFQWP